MDEFQMVVSEYKRMCESYKNCDFCPMPIFGCDKDACRRYVFKCPEESKNTIMTWAAEHPEPVYPTWEEYLEKLMTLDMMCGLTDNHISVENYMRKTQIPAVLAQKLGVKPKEASK